MADSNSNTSKDDATPMDDAALEKAAERAHEGQSEADVFDFGDGAPMETEETLDETGEPRPPQSPLEFLEQQLAAVEAERDTIKDKMLRALAEGENIRRRAMKDREEGEKYGGVRLARDLLAVYDNLDRTLQAADESVRASAPEFFEGVELTRRELLNAFAKHHIAPVAPEVGDRFDPNLHQAMFEAPAPGAANNTVIQVMQQGFTISDRLLRAAMVGVAKNPAGTAAPSAPDEPQPDEPSAARDPEQAP